MIPKYWTENSWVSADPGPGVPPGIGTRYLPGLSWFLRKRHTSHNCRCLFAGTSGLRIWSCSGMPCLPWPACCWRWEGWSSLPVLSMAGTWAQRSACATSVTPSATTSWRWLLQGSWAGCRGELGPQTVWEKRHYQCSLAWERTTPCFMELEPELQNSSVPLISGVSAAISTMTDSFPLCMTFSRYRVDEVEKSWGLGSTE